METKENNSGKSVWYIILQAISAAIGALLGSGII